MIEVFDLKKTFTDSERGEFYAVNGVTFTCTDGEIFGLLGPNGAGKTTTLRILSTLLAPTSGTVSVNGFDILKQPQDVRRSIGFLSSTTGLYPRLTPRETLLFFARLHGLSKEDSARRAENLIRELGMTSYADVRCEKLSSGMKQKASIARALIHDPPVLIFDEPTVGLDVLAAAQTLNFIQAYRRTGKCILYSTHIMSEAEKLCDRIAVIHKGSIRAVGTLDELRELTGQRYLEDIFMALVRSDEVDV